MKPAGKQLKIDEVKPEGNTELVRFHTGEVVIGREPGPEGITLANQAVSRQHGTFFRIRNHWLFKDLGSTNGSWVNSVQVRPNSIRIVRPGDVVQMADSVLRLSLVNEGPAGGMAEMASIPGRSIMVFSKDQFLDEFPVPEYGRALVVGGAQADLEIEGVLNDLPSLVIERKGMDTTAFSVAKGISIQLNGQELTEQQNLQDGDELTVAYFSLLINDPTTSGGAAAGQQAGMTAAKSSVQEWGGQQQSLAAGRLTGEGRGSGQFMNKQAPNSLFGKTQAVNEDEEDDLMVEETMTIDPRAVESKLSGRDMHPSMRFNMDDEQSKFSFGALEDKLLIIFGFGLLLALMIAVAYWLIH